MMRDDGGGQPAAAALRLAGAARLTKSPCTHYPNSFGFATEKSAVSRVMGTCLPAAATCAADGWMRQLARCAAARCL
jgi:hypothetical protein